MGHFACRVPKKCATLQLQVICNKNNNYGDHLNEQHLLPRS